MLTFFLLLLKTLNVKETIWQLFYALHLFS